MINCAGVDEAGRGAWAGPVIAAAVILHPDRVVAGIQDSKLLTMQQREYLFWQIQDQALALGVGEASVQEIEQYNILQATLLAMQRAVAQLATAPELVLVDGQHSPVLSYPVKTVIKGDQKVIAIAAASIIAKVTRDRLMIGYDQQLPQYGFAQHKGYGTKQHLYNLQQHGPAWLHRQTFKPLKKLLVTKHT